MVHVIVIAARMNCCEVSVFQSDTLFFVACEVGEVITFKQVQSVLH